MISLSHNNDLSLANPEKLYLNPSWLAGNDDGKFLCENHC